MKMRSTGFHFTLGVSGLRVCLLDVVQPFTTIRDRSNRPQLYTLHFTLRTLHSALYTPHLTVYIPHSAHSTFYTPHSTLHALHSTRLHFSQFTAQWYCYRGNIYHDFSNNLLQKRVLCEGIWVHGLHLVLLR